MTPEQRDRKRARERVSGMTVARVDHKRARQRLSGMSPEQVEKRRARSTRWYQKIAEDWPRYQHMCTLKTDWSRQAATARSVQRIVDLFQEDNPRAPREDIVGNLFSPLARSMDEGTYWANVRAREAARYAKAMLEREGRLSLGLPRDTTWPMTSYAAVAAGADPCWDDLTVPRPKQRPKLPPPGALA
jgi:hypothetical protein